MRLAEQYDFRRNWNAIDSFIRAWISPCYERNVADDRIRKLEDGVGQPFPVSVREWCAFALSSEQIADGFSFRDCFEIERMPEHRAISLLLQGEADFHWAFAEADANASDPLITGYYLDYDGPTGGFVEQGLFAPSVSSFALDYLLTYLNSAGGGFGVRIRSPAYDRPALIADLGPPATFGHLELFETDELVAFTSTFADNWHHDMVSVRFRRRVATDRLTPSIRRLLAAAHWIQGPIDK